LIHKAGSDGITLERVGKHCATGRIGCSAQQYFTATDRGLAFLQQKTAHFLFVRNSPKDFPLKNRRFIDAQRPFIVSWNTSRPQALPLDFPAADQLLPPGS
jgi:hypothetical protein